MRGLHRAVRVGRLLLMEDEPARWLAPAGNRAAAILPWDSISPSSATSRLFTPGGGSSMESEPARAAGAVSNADGRDSVAVRVRRSPHKNGRRAVGAATGFESLWRPPGRGAR